MDDLQQKIGSRHFTELFAYKKRNTLSPDVWNSAARMASIVAHSFTGHWIPPHFMLPGKEEELKRQAKHREQRAEESLDRAAQKGEQ